MAILDKSKKTFNIDRNENVFIGLDLPLDRSDGAEGWFGSTKFTIDAARINIKNLLSTERGERLMQPNLGLNLRKYLFEQEMTEEVEIEIQQEVADTLKLWLPSVFIHDMQIRFGEIGNDKHTLGIHMKFSIVQDPNTIADVDIDVRDNIRHKTL